MMLKTACRARSEVGRVSAPSGATRATPLWLPASMRIRLLRLLLLLRLLRRGRRAEAELFLQHLAHHLFDRALVQMAELERAVGDADQAADRPAEMAAELADLAVLALGQCHGEPGIVALLAVERGQHLAI